jgi:hypothetical protein
MAQLRFRNVAGVVVRSVLAMFPISPVRCDTGQTGVTRQSGDGYRASQNRAVGVRFFFSPCRLWCSLGSFAPRSSLSASILWLVVLGAALTRVLEWGRRARVRHVRLALVLAIAAGLIIGALVLALDVFLQPGQAVYGAAG